MHSWKSSTRRQPAAGIMGYASYAVMIYSFMYLLVFGSELAATFPALRLVFPGAHTINATTNMPMGTALLIDLFLFLLWGVQHSCLARPRVQHAIENVASKTGERLIYAGTSVLCAYLMVAWWQPITNYYIWDLSNSMFFGALSWLGTAIGVFYVVASLATSVKYDLFSMHSKMTGDSAPQVPSEVLPWVYKFTRHPLFFGFVLAFWSASFMTLGRFVFALGWTIYTGIGSVLQDRDLANKVEGYAYYQRKVSSFVPWPNDYIPMHERGRTRASVH